MNFVYGLLTPFNSGYIYGTTLAMTTSNQACLISPLLTLVDTGATALLYGASAELASRFIFPEKAQYLLSGVLLVSSAYRAYTFFKNTRTNKIRGYCCPQHEQEDAQENTQENTKEDVQEDSKDNIQCECVDNKEQCVDNKEESTQTPVALSDEYIEAEESVVFSTMEEVD